MSLMVCAGKLVAGSEGRVWIKCGAGLCGVVWQVVGQRMWREKACKTSEAGEG